LRRSSSEGKGSGLAGADVAAEHGQLLAAVDRAKEIVERRRVGPALIEEPRVGRQAEGLFAQAVERLVGETRRSKVRLDGTEYGAIERGRHAWKTVSVSARDVPASACTVLHRNTHVAGDACAASLTTTAAYVLSRDIAHSFRG
jgi:hypothetical protein